MVSGKIRAQVSEECEKLFFEIVCKGASDAMSLQGCCFKFAASRRFSDPQI